MKAKDYYEKYKNSLESKNIEVKADTVRDISNDLLEEAKELVNLRKCYRDSAVMSVLKEMNDKMNAINNFINDNIKIPRNIFINAWEEHIKRNDK